MEMLVTHRCGQQAIRRRQKGDVVSAVAPGALVRPGLLAVIAVMLAVNSSVFGQFLVSPLKMDDIQLEPGKRIARTLSIENMTNQNVEQVDLAIVDVMQDPNGAWTPIQAGDPNVDWSKIRSCAKWVTLDRPMLRLNPFQKVTFNVFLAVPPRTQGFYCAAVTAKALLAAGTVEGYTSAVAVEYVIPILLEVKGRTMRNEVELTDIGLEYGRLNIADPAATLATLGVENKGGTFCRLQGYIRISNWWGNHWRRITECQFADVGIIPGAKLLLKRDVGKPLPKGKYKLEGFLIVNGVRADQTEDADFQFAGDPRIATGGTVEAMTALDFDPRELVLESVPGSMKTDRIQVVNATDNPVNVTVDTMLPEHFNSIVATDPNTGRQITGEEYGCNKWVTIEPNQFQLTAYGKQTLVVKVNVPKTATGLPNYYSVITLRSTYPDGQPAGVTKGRICLLMKKTSGAPRLVAKSVSVSELSATKYQIFARTFNMGTTHILPRCYAAVLTTPEANVLQRVQLSSEAYNQVGNLLPLEPRNFSGAIDVAGIKPGTYILGISLESESGKPPAEQFQYSLKVGEANGKKTVEVGLEAVGQKIKARF